METIRLIVTQTLVPKIGGGRLALREYMEFTEAIREQLLDLPYEKWPVTLMNMVAVHGKTMEKSARDAFNAGLIEKRYYLMYAQGTKTADDGVQDGDMQKAQ
jgi:defect in organelle trafficking protein DotB